MRNAIKASPSNLFCSSSQQYRKHICLSLFTFGVLEDTFATKKCTTAEAHLKFKAVLLHMFNARRHTRDGWFNIWALDAAGMAVFSQSLSYISINI